MASNKISCGKGTGSFSCGLKSLPANTTIYVRAYATDINGTAYGNQQTFKTPANDSAVTMYINGGSKLFAINASSGALKWRVDVGGHLLPSPEYANNTVFVCVNNNEICAFDTTGNLKWTAQLPVAAADDTLQYFLAQIKFYNNILFVAPANQLTVFALNPATGTVLWTHQNASTGYGVINFIFDGNSIYLNYFNSITCLDIQTGQQKLSIPAPSGNASFGPILIFNNKLYALVGEDNLYVYDKNSGSSLWYKSFANDIWVGGGQEIDYNGYALYCTFSDGLSASVTEAVDTVNGTKIFSISNPYLAGSVRILSDNELYFVPYGQTFDAFSGDLVSGPGGSGSGYGGALTSNGTVIINHKKYSAAGDSYGIFNYTYGYVYCFNYLTQATQWTSTVSYNFIYSYPCVVTQSGKAYR